MDDEEDLNRENFEMLLAWLGPDRESGGVKYEAIRERLLHIFTWNGCKNPTDWADRTISTVMKKLPDLVNKYSGDPARYFYGVANKLIHEYFREESKHSDSQPDSLVYVFKEDKEASRFLSLCLDECLEQLSIEDRDLFLEYYQYDKKTKIKERRQLAERLGIQISVLRSRAFEIRMSLSECIRGCVKRKSQSE